MIAVSKLRVKRVRDVPLGHLVALPQADATLLGIVVESPPELKVGRVVLGLCVEIPGAGRMPYLLTSSSPEQCFDFGTAATFLWPPAIARISPRWHAGLRTGHLAVTENVVAINGCYGRQQVKHGYWDISSGKMVRDNYTMFLAEWQLGVPDHQDALDVLLNFPADFAGVSQEVTQKMSLSDTIQPRSMLGA